MPRLSLTLPLLLALLTGCTISAKANPAIDTTVSSARATATVVPALSPAEAAKERLTAVLGASRLASLATVTAAEGAVTVALSVPPTTLGGAEEYWTVCGALAPLLGSSAITAVTTVAPDGRPVVGASVTAPSCALLPS